MKKRYNLTRYNKALLASTVAAAVLMTGSQALAGHDLAIDLKGPDGVVITSLSGDAYSPQATCGTSGCHDYDAIERHSFHAQLGANQHKGWNAFKNGQWNSVGCKSKPWVQSPGHVGKW